MRIFPEKDALIEELKKVLVKNDDIDTTLEIFRDLYASLNLNYPLAKPFSIRTIETESLRYSVFYQSGPELSKYAIEIEHVEYSAYLWKDGGEWCLDDDLYKPQEIAQELAEAPLLKKVPESVKDLEFLLAKGFWEFSEVLPKFGGDAPKDGREALSWDSTNILTGTKLENISIVSRPEWERLTNNENHWFE